MDQTVNSFQKLNQLLISEAKLKISYNAQEETKLIFEQKFKQTILLSLKLHLILESRPKQNVMSESKVKIEFGFKIKTKDFVTKQISF